MSQATSRRARRRQRGDADRRAHRHHLGRRRDGGPADPRRDELPRDRGPQGGRRHVVHRRHRRQGGRQQPPPRRQGAGLGDADVPGLVDRLGLHRQRRRHRVLRRRRDSAQEHPRAEEPLPEGRRPDGRRLGTGRVLRRARDRHLRRRHRRRHRRPRSHRLVRPGADDGRDDGHLAGDDAQAARDGQHGGDAGARRHRLEVLHQRHQRRPGHRRLRQGRGRLHRRRSSATRRRRATSRAASRCRPHRASAADLCPDLPGPERLRGRAAPSSPGSTTTPRL